jgi:ribosomal protein S18 acetylase RimI-like enzyme
MLIRDYKSADFPIINELWDETGLGGNERGDSKEVVEECLSKGGKLLVMEEEKSAVIVGTSWMTFDGRRIHLHHFCIRPEYQGKGYGKILTEASLRFVKQMGHQVKLEVDSNNKIAKHLYETFGFQKFSGYDIYMIRDVRNMRLKK